MPSDSSIYSMIRPPAPQPGPLDSYTQGLQVKHMMAQGQLGEIQRRKLESDMAEEDAFKGVLRNAADPTKVNIGDLYRASPTRATAYDKAQLERRKTEGDIARTQVQTQADQVKVIREIASQVNSDADMPMAREQALAVVGPDRFKHLPFFNQPFTPENKIRAIAGADETLKRLSPELKPTDIGGKIVPVNPYTGAQQPGTEAITKTATPGEVMTDARTRSEGAANRGVTIRGQNQPVWDGERGVFVTRPDAGGAGPAGPAATPAGATPVPAGAVPVTPAPGPRVITPTGLPPKAGDVMALRKEFNDLPEVKNYRAVVPIINSAANAPDNKSGDIQFAYTIGKIFDPNSVVREGELKLVGDAANVMQKYMGELQALTEGKGRLTPQTRAELMAAAQARVNELKSVHDIARTTYEKQAKAQGLPGDQIFVEVGTGPKKDPAKPVEAKKTIGRTNYVKIDGQWFEDSK